MFDWSREVKIAEERYKDERRNVEYWRLVEEAERARPHRPSLPARMLVTLGGRLSRLLARMGGLLVRWGCQLETRYTEMKQSAVAATMETSTGPPCSSA